MIHFHRYEPFVSDAIAYFRKQEGQDSDVYFRGDVEMCACNKSRFVPVDRRLRVVEVEIERRKK